MNSTSSTSPCAIFGPLPEPVGLFRDLGAAGFTKGDVAKASGCNRDTVDRFLAANSAAKAAYTDARRGYKGPGGKRAALRLGLVEKDVDALIVAGVLYLDQRGDEQSRDCLARLARHLALTGAPDVETCLLALARETGDPLYG